MSLPRPNDFKFVVSLQDSNRKSVGFLPYMAIREYFDHGHVWVARENNEPCGYLLFGGNSRKRLVGQRSDFGTMKIIQACIQYDARRVEHATELVRRLETRASAEGYERIGLWCAEDLEANAFWQSMCYELVGTRLGGNPNSANCKRRIHNRWLKVLPDPPQMQLFV